MSTTPTDRNVWVRIIYRSGVTLDLHCTDIHVHRSSASGALRRLDLTNPSPQPAHLGVAHIAAVWTQRLDQADP